MVPLNKLKNYKGVIRRLKKSKFKRNVSLKNAISLAGWRFILKLAIDCLILCISLYFSFLLRFEGKIPLNYFSLLPFYFSVESLILLIWWVLFSIYKSLWRYTGFKDFLYVTFAVSLQKLTVTAFYFIFSILSFPRSVIIISWAFTLIGGVGIRALRRYLYELQRTGDRETGEEEKVLIIGAGSAGRRLAQEISQNPRLGYKIVGFLDDDPTKRGSYIFGYQVLGSIDEVGKVVKDYDVEEVIIALPSVPQKAREIFNALIDIPVKVTLLPGIGKLAMGRPLYESIKEIDLADLLPRPPVEVDVGEIARFLNKKIVMVTGAGGSIGSELCRQLSSFPLDKLILLDHSENPLFFIEQELKELRPSFPIYTVVVDIRNANKIKDIFRTYRPQIVFHTAAHKHVPMMELNPDEAITNNVYGTMVLAEAAIEASVEKFIYISTDKAVNPVNVMGATKRVGELLMMSLNKNSSTDFISVRFGNVLGSKGSVLEVWEKCIEEHKPLPITHPDMERYFMTIPEAVNLILKAAELGKGGELFVLDMGERIKVMELASLYTRLRGLLLNKDIHIKITGIRPGEKLKEELVGEGEIVKKTTHSSIMQVVSDEEIEADFPRKLDALLQSALTRDPAKIKSALKQVVKNFKEPEAID